jgi:hypothetical protein
MARRAPSGFLRASLNGGPYVVADPCLSRHRSVDTKTICTLRRNANLGFPNDDGS